MTMLEKWQKRAFAAVAAVHKAEAAEDWLTAEVQNEVAKTIYAMLNDWHQWAAKQQEEKRS